MKSVVKFAAVFAAAVIAVGCAQSGGVSEDKPIEQVKQEASAMDVAKLEATVEKYKAMIESKSAEIDEIKAELKKIPVTELMGEEAKAIKADIEEVTTSVQALTERMKVYAAELKSKMAAAE